MRQFIDKPYRVDEQDRIRKILFDLAGGGVKGGKSLSSTRVSAPVRIFIKEDFPALV